MTGLKITKIPNKIINNIFEKIPTGFNSEIFRSVICNRNDVNNQRKLIKMSAATQIIATSLFVPTLLILSRMEAEKVIVPTKPKTMVENIPKTVILSIFEFFKSALIASFLASKSAY